MEIDKGAEGTDGERRPEPVLRRAVPQARRPRASLFGNRRLTAGAKLVLASEIMRRPRPLRRGRPERPVS